MSDSGHYFLCPSFPCSCITPATPTFSFSVLCYTPESVRYRSHCPRKLLRRILHDEIGARAFNSVLIWIAINDRVLAAEIVPGRRTGSRPLQGNRVPRIVWGRCAFETAVDQIEQKDQLRCARAERSDGDEPMHGNQRLHIVIHKRRSAPDVAHQSQVMKRHENAVRTDESNPEVNSAELLIQHVARHFREPEVSPGKDAEDGGDAHHHMEVADYEIGRV